MILKLYKLYLQKKFSQCLEEISKYPQESASNELLLLKAECLKSTANLTESLKLFQLVSKRLGESDQEIRNKILILLCWMGKYKNVTSTTTDSVSDWVGLHCMAIAYICMRQLDNGIKCLLDAIQLYPNEYSFRLLGRIYCHSKKYSEALYIYNRAIESNYISRKDYFLVRLAEIKLKYSSSFDQLESFDSLSKALVYNRDSNEALLGINAIFINNYEYSIALNNMESRKQSLFSSRQWNNIGICFAGLDKQLAAVACLKRALYLNPVDWKILYNLGLCHLVSGQACSAFVFLNACVNLNSKFANGYGWLAVALSWLNDEVNALVCYRKAIEISQQVEDEYLDKKIVLNYVITLYRYGQVDKARQELHNHSLLLQVEESHGQEEQEQEEQDESHDFKKIYQNINTLLN